MKKLKKTFCILCALCLTLSFSAAVLADGEEEGPQDSQFWTAEGTENLVQTKFSEGSSYSTVKYSKTAEGEDKPFVELTIAVSQENSLKYRKSLANDGIDLKEYSEGALEAATLGGIEFAVVKTENWGKERTCYYGRDVASQISVKITVEGVQDDPDVTGVLETISFILPEGSGEEAPYPWEGEPLVTETGSQEINGHTVTATQIIGDESLLPTSIFDNRIAVAGDIVYLLSQKLLYIYQMDGDTMKIQEKVDLPDVYTSISVDENGMVYVTAFNHPVLLYKDGKAVEGEEAGKAAAVKGEMIVSPDGSFLMEYFTRTTDLKKVDLATGEKTDFVVTGDDELQNVSQVCMDDAYVFLCGSNDSKHWIHVTDPEGSYLMTLKDEDDSSLGSITAAAVTSDGFIALDGNMRTVVFWDTEGKWLGEIDDGKLFGTHYPWMSGMCRVDENTYYISLCEERTDSSWDEIVVYRLTID